MIWLVGSITYGLVAIVALRVLMPHFAYWYLENTMDRWKLSRKTPDGEQWLGAFLTTLPIALLWPAAILWAFDFPSVGAAGRAKIRQQQEHIRELEREAGIR